MGFDLYMLGCEQPAWRSLLRDLDVKNVGLSYYAVRKRLPKKKAYSMDWGFEKVFLDSGGYAANKEPEKATQREWRAYGREYADFALEHIDDVEFVSEFDCLALGTAWIRQMREEVWDHIPVEKFLPVWHPEQGPGALQELGERYRRVGIAQAHIAEPGLNFTPVLNRLANDGVQLHGLAMSRPDAIRHVRFSSASSTSWLSPMRFGETIIWDGAKLVRYPTKMKDQARMRHRNDFERAGFDVEKVMADDSREVVRVSVWSWLQFEASMNKNLVGRADRVTQPDGDDVGDAADTDGAPVTQDGQEMRKAPVALRVRTDDEITPLPVFGYITEEVMDTDSNKTVRNLLPVVNRTSVRTCDNCFVRTECPAFQERSTCSYSIPIEVRTPGQKLALFNGMIEIQAQRVAFMRYREELSGGYADPNLSQEMDRLANLFVKHAELTDEREYFRMNVEARGKAGVLSRLFGEKAADVANPLPRGLDAAGTDTLLARVIQGKVE